MGNPASPVAKRQGYCPTTCTSRSTPGSTSRSKPENLINTVKRFRQVGACSSTTAGLLLPKAVARLLSDGRYGWQNVDPGLGNPILTDDGVGIHVVRAVAAHVSVGRPGFCRSKRRRTTPYSMPWSATTALSWSMPSELPTAGRVKSIYCIPTTCAPRSIQARRTTCRLPVRWPWARSWAWCCPLTRAFGHRRRRGRGRADLRRIVHTCRGSPLSPRPSRWSLPAF